MQDAKEKNYRSTELFMELESISTELRKQKQKLTSDLSIADKKKTDIEHYIEFCSLSASQGYKASKMLKDCLEERRQIKNELEVIENILRMNIGFIGKGKGEKVLESTKVKQYKPRVLKELFNS